MKAKMSQPSLSSTDDVTQRHADSTTKTSKSPFEVGIKNGKTKPKYILGRVTRTGGADLCSIAVNQTPTYTGTQHHTLLHYSSTLPGTHRAHPRRDGQAELIWLADYIPRWFTRPQIDGHPSKS